MFSEKAKKMGSVWKLYRNKLIKKKLAKHHMEYCIILRGNKKIGINNFHPLYLFGMVTSRTLLPFIRKQLFIINTYNYPYTS